MKLRIVQKILIYLLFATNSLSNSAYAESFCSQIFTGKQKTEVIVSLIDVSVQNNQNAFDTARQRREVGEGVIANQILDNLTDMLNTMEIINVEYLGGGVNDSYRVTLSNGLQGVFKPMNPDRPNQPAREAAAYKLSRLLDLDIVPPTVVRAIEGKGVPGSLLNKIGSLQLFIHTAKPLQKGISSDGSPILVRKGKEYKVTKTESGKRLRIFDWLINNHDRGSNAGNYLVSSVDGSLIGIDHSVSFVGHDKSARKDKVPYYKMKYLKDEEFYERLTSKSEDEIQVVLSELNPTRIKEFFIRYHKLLLDYRIVLEK